MANRRYHRRKKNGSFIGFVVFVVIVAIVVVAALYFTGRLNLPDIFGKGDDKTVETEQPADSSSSSSADRGASYGTIDGTPIKIHFVFVGQGDAMVVELPLGKYMVVDAGSGARASADTATQTRYYEYLDDVVEGNTIDYLVVTHPDSDHVNMMSKVVDRYEIKNFYFNEYESGSKTYQTFVNKAKAEEGATLNIIDNADNSTKEFSVGACSVKMYSPGNDGFKGTHCTQQNSMSIITLITYGERKLLLSGDAPEEEEEWFMDYVGGTVFDIDFLKVAHHGSQYSSTNGFLTYVKAEYAVICVDAEHNTYNHPTKDALDRLAAADMTVYRTDTDGTVVLTIDSDGDYEFTFKK